MTKINKTDLENILFIKKQLKIKNINTVKIKKGNYEIELSSSINSTPLNIATTKTKEDKTLSENEIIKSNVKAENIVKSPMVGVAYLSADPNSPSYVKVGQHVKAGDTLLLIEAMKTFNEIKAPRSGIIKKIVALNSQPVEYGDTLIIFE